MKIEETGWYITRGGSAVFIRVISQDQYFKAHGRIYIDGRWVQEAWMIDGRYEFDGEHELDIVDKMVE